MTSIGIIGSGFGALSVAIELRRAGHTDLRLWERAHAIGGVWRDNTYPGAACDVPSPLYSFSYEPYAGWSHRYAGQPQILRYLQRTADKYGITPLVQFGHDVVSAHFDEDAASWTVRFADGREQVVDILVSAVGQLSQPALPSIPGVDTFEGQAFHSARWRHDVDLTGKRVAVVGTGGSAIQFIPHVAEQAAHLTVFQRTPSYILPKPDQRIGSIYRAALRRVPGALRGERAGWWTFGEQFSRGLDDDSKVGKVISATALKHLAVKVKDPELRAKLTPDYPVGCKRILFANTYYPAITRPNVHLVADGIASVTPTGVVTDAGTAHDVDVIIYATGFDSQEFLESIDITGVAGQKLAEQWVDGARAYLGIYVPNFPNLFLSYGPNTNLGGGSIVYMLEAQARHIRQAVDRLVAGSYRTVEVTRDAEETYDREVQSKLSHSVWAHCNSWYRHASGRITSNWPGSTHPYAQRTKTLEPDAFEWA
ncbi:flavin-containing monooxygenase [Aeromicrobium wangtongii]|uniref:NAD(P)/FAD-dependent oxidoreductase n=1 Tax=Aeromicrobium wangtongii TaxID=2969247 RepID=A0ABY5M209_9ACTN|nr:NAD(P)/FAD-dependent oxidoreductase [Aeromicrobium wangtongii]MCD9198212.1 NAD(P)/FAD-dependent oxidoreductase [Aeromicrobium wangtongii]UUP12248.1 NAD(P)/FAD-dependent oxidoreductase [Aeromicrobium wangtongii]